MTILAIETSCDETAIAILECEGDEQSARFQARGNALLSQIEVHKPYGGVYPALAKREHAKNLIPILEAALEEAELLHEDAQVISHETRDAIAKLLEREPGLEEAFFDFVSECEPPRIDAIAVTAGPGLEPALWVGINFAKALALVWQKPLVAVNHMEGHVIAALASGNHVASPREDHDAMSALASGTHATPPSAGSGAISTPSSDTELRVEQVQLPVLALLISGGHTELVLMRTWLSYELIGQTRDDAVGEAFDKVARMLGLPYPGGPEVSRLAELLRARPTGLANPYTLPRPMLRDDTCDFSFAGLKTAVMHLLKGRDDLSDTDKQHLAHEFENAVAEVLWKKTERAIEATHAATLVIGGGVSANTHIRRVFREQVALHSDIALRIPAAALTTDNAVMIGLAGFYRASRKEFADPATLVANGTRSLA